jgi:hypothetical protein
MESVKDLIKKDGGDFKKTLVNRHKYVSKEFQDYGYRIAHKLGELKNVSLYIKLAKEKPRVWMDQAFSFAIDYPNAKNKGRLFMWKLKELEDEFKKREKKKIAKKK